MSNKSVFSKLSKSAKKGENGTILIIGGSEKYSGAPISTAFSALRSGSDLVYIMTDVNAASTIKLLFEAIVLPLQFDTLIFDKITACVIGPGLEITYYRQANLIKQIVNYLDQRNVPFVIDADAFDFYKNGEMGEVKTCVLTPDYKESTDLVVLKDHFCIYKGEKDIIEHNEKRIEIYTPSSLKRCGGQGDILNGILATALSLEKENILEACTSACELTRKSSSRAFKLKGFSLVLSDIFESITFFIKNVNFEEQ